MKRLIVFFFTLILPLFAWTQTNSFAESFKSGTQLYVAKDYAKARDAFANAVAADPHNTTAITNLALSEFQLGKKSLAIALLRKALSLDPEYTTARAGLKFALSQMDIRDVPHQLETYESLRKKILSPVPLTAYLILAALLLFAAGWTFINFASTRKKALAEEKAPPGFPIFASLFTIGFLVSVSLVVLKMYDSSVKRATIVEDKISLQTAAGENQASILDLYGGMEVIVNATEKEWSQITYPGSFTGWVKSSSLYVTSAD